MKISNDNTFLHFITITLSFNPYATIGLGFNTPFSLFHSMEEEVCFFHFKVKKTCLCVNFSPTGEKLTFSGLFHLEVKKHTLGKIVKNHQYSFCQSFVQPLWPLIMAFYSPHYKVSLSVKCSCINVRGPAKT